MGPKGGVLGHVVLRQSGLLLEGVPTEKYQFRVIVTKTLFFRKVTKMETIKNETNFKLKPGFSDH
jgi:hypothetical protein